MKMTWLLLRGLMREGRHWGEFPKKLEDILGDNALCLDLPGFGTEYGRKVPSTIAKNVSDLRERWLKVKGEGPHGIIAMSLGGMVALDWQERHPEDFSSVVIMSSSTMKDSLPYERLRPWGMKQVLNVAKKLNLQEKEREVLELVSNKRENLEETSKLWAGFAEEYPPKIPSALKQITAAASYFGPKTLNKKTLFLHGQGDKMVHPKCTVKMAKRLGGDYFLHPWAGHDLAFDDGEWVLNKIKEWMEEGRAIREQ